jgi:hypothetical protein
MIALIAAVSLAACLSSSECGWISVLFLRAIVGPAQTALTWGLNKVLRLRGYDEARTESFVVAPGDLWKRVAFQPCQLSHLWQQFASMAGITVTVSFFLFYRSAENFQTLSDWMHAAVIEALILSVA